MATVPELTETLSRPSARFSPKPVGLKRAKRPRWAAFFLIFGLFLTFRGYHSFDGDQAYRLPLLLHLQDASLYANDFFVKAFNQFNPHRGYLTLLDWTSRPFGLASALLGLFALTLAMTSFSFDRLARLVWPEAGGKVGLVCVILVLLAKAGNIGTNHLFESTLLDRLIGFALGWQALSLSIRDGYRGIWLAAGCLGMASLVHPSVGLQMALTLAVSWVVWSGFSGLTGVSRTKAVLAIVALGVALAPGLILMAGQGGSLFKGLSGEEFRLLAVQVQGPQHLLPSTWRMPQWLAWFCYPVLAGLALIEAQRPWPAARIRLALLMGVNLVSLVVAYLAVEVVGDLRVTIFQPFRMATLARGLALVAVSGRVVSLWNRGDLFSRGRAVLIGAGLGGDWSLIVASAVDLGMAASEGLRISERLNRLIGLALLGFGLIFLARHDTESGHLPLIGSLAVLLAWTLKARQSRGLSVGGAHPTRFILAMGVCWAVPLASLVVGLVMEDPGGTRWSAGLVERCRFSEVPTDDLERLAVWTRDHTPSTSRFIGPPGPKTFRLWSRRAVAFNRAASPYHAAGLADWSMRFRDHVGFHGSTAEFARAYLADRHGLEAAYGRMTDDELARLAISQGANHVLASSARVQGDPESPLVRLKVEGRYAVYRVEADR
jgi:hypothetical protein